MIGNRTSYNPARLSDFVAESHRIEGIDRVTEEELKAHKHFICDLSELRVFDVEELVRVCAGAPLRRKPGMDVRIGNHLPEPGGPHVEHRLQMLLEAVNENLLTPWEEHCEYEMLHAFMDGNGRSGRAVWAHHMLKLGQDPFRLGFLHSFYYQTLEKSPGRR